MSRRDLERSRRLVLPAMLARSARRVPDKTALVFGDERRTYAELEKRTDRLASALAERGVMPGDRVALLLHNGLEIIESFFACHKAGACPLPVNFRLVDAEVRYILEDSGAVGVITGGDLQEVTDRAADGLDAVGFGLVAGNSYEEAIASAAPQAPDVLQDEDDLAFLMYTSGTTGRPKGAMLTHQNLFFSTLSWVHEIGAHADDVWLSGQPLFHIGGVNGLLPFIHLGATVIVSPTTRFDPALVVDLMKRHAVTRCVFVPTQWQDICTQPTAVELNTGTLKSALWGASAAPRATLELMERTFAGVDIVSAFGQTEMSGTTTLLKGADSLRKLGSVGKPVVGVEIRIVGDDGEDVEQGAVGELLYRGPMVMKGYHGREDATDEAFEDGWLRSGDLLREDEEGFLTVVDRKKDMIISGGENVYPAEVERVLLTHPGIAEAAVVGIPHPRWVETPLAVLVATEDAPAEDEIVAFCRERLAGYKKPSGAVFVNALPRNAAGKILKRELRDRYGDRFTADARSA